MTTERHIVTRRGFLKGTSTLGLTAGLAGTGLLAACGTSSSSGSAAGSGSGTVQMHHDAAVGPLFAPFVKYFNAHYKPLQMTTSYVANDYATVTNQQLAAGDASYDVLYSDEGYLQSWTKNAWVKPLADFTGLSKLTGNLNPGVADALKGSDGQVDALPYFRGAEIFVVNTQHLAAIKASAPTTWDEFMSQARELKAKGIAQTPYSPYWINYAFLMWHQFAAETASEGGGELFDAKAAPQMTDNSVAASTLARWQTLYKEGLVPKDVFTTDYGDVTNIFAGGKSSFSMRYQAQVVGWRDPTQSPAAPHVKNVIIPGSTGQTHSFGSYWMMAGSTKDPENAWTALNYLGGAGKDGSYYVPKQLVAINLGLSSGYASVDSDPDVLKSWAKWADVPTLQKQLSNTVSLGPVVNQTWYPAFATQACATLQEIVIGQKSIPAGLKALSDAATSAAAK
jgi:ABC-type glycerol-3-phosphate transport system substrate-binding protein